MRRLAGLLVVPLLLLSTAACGNDTKGSDNASMTNGLPAITAGAKFGEKPTLAKGEGDPPKELKVNVVSEGDGPVTKEGDALQVNYLGQTWDSTTPFDNSFDRGEPFTLTLGAGQVIKGWDQGLKGQKVGSRVEIGIPPELGYGEQGSPPSIKGGATLVFVVDILKATTVPKAAEGTVVAQENKDLPKVGTNTDGKAPSLTVPKTDPPKELVSNYVIEGKGEAVKASDTLTVQYQGVLWKDGKKFDSSYDRGAPATFQLGGVIKGWSKGLEGKKVGSRVLLVVPPADGYGDQAQGPIPAKSTLVFTVDILAKQ
ncbi:FKBP-type peptidyl-prolyl cis-trans isomerase [Streptomyces filamentosus]|uniref:Peptidyl-prolyl cis-trans isomerase n=1 Tax=Streptomyces filamentosus TaxID=67294 RepID=A0A919BWZ6_STRFL|nr:FKBP-type peptidyl-prolyl cis-trans isomerase [Streptomyces filamentosus]KAA6216786.1 FKBP-type peptidyl-prolyl cis-trans isomerase [Streptomyces filamentosus]GHG20029.1 peptidylprolyl isomerase [Streptomyces filamentosus]